MTYEANAQTARNEATEIYGQMKTLLDGAGAAGFGAEQSATFDTLSAAFDAKTAMADRFEKTAKQEKAEVVRGRLGAGTPTAPSADPRIAESRKAFAALLRGDSGTLKHEIRFTSEAGTAMHATTAAKGLLSTKDLQANIDAAGGFLLAPQMFVAQFIRFVDDEVFIRQLATKFMVDNAESLGAPAMDGDIEDADWTTELAVGGTSTVQPFGKRELKPSPLAKQIKVSKKLLRQSTIDVEAYVAQRLAYKHAIPQEKAFLTGSGASQPLGVFTPSSLGISTARDVTAAAPAALAGDDFLNLKHSLKAAYWTRPNTRWILSRPVLNAVRKLKDTTNNYLWAPGLGPGGGLTGGVPATLVDVPYVISEYAPSTITTGLYTAIIGDF